MDINKTLSKLLGNNEEIKEVQIDTRVVDEIVNIAIESDPEEYVALLSGKISKNILKVSGLVFLPFKASSTSASMDMFMMPMTTDAVGSVHSHPGPSAQPSDADRMFFGKNGYFHIIICRPYSPQTMRAYDVYGNPMTFQIADLEDDVDIKRLNDINLEDGTFEQEDISSTSQPEENENKGSDLMTDPEKNNKQPDKKPNNENKKHQGAMLNLQIESNGKMLNQQIPLPPEYEPGDQVEVDIRTDKTPGDTIDEIILNVKKPNKSINSKVTDLDELNKEIENTNQPKANETNINSTNDAKDKVIDVDKKPESKESDEIVDAKTKNQSKSSSQIQKEIEDLEADINKLKAENERLKKEFKD